MTTVRVSCPECAADIKIESTGFLLTIFDTGNATYEYFCLACRQHIMRPADSRARSLLELAQAPVHKVHVPHEFFEHNDGPPITEADVDSFDLEFEDWASARHDSNVRPSA